MNDKQKGQYISLLCLQYSKGFLTKEEIEASDAIVASKFYKREEYFYSKEVEFLKDKELKYSESRSNNRKNKKLAVEHIKKIVKNTESTTFVKKDFIYSIVEQFKLSYEENHDSEYDLMTIGREREMAAKILGKHKKKFPESSSEEMLLKLRSYFDLCNKISDPWLNSNMSLSLIVSKFNEINNILKNGTIKKNSPATSGDAILRSIADTFGRK
jgi:hypothetical protein